MHDGSRRAILAAFLADLGTAVATFVGFVITGSAGLRATAGHARAGTAERELRAAVPTSHVACIEPDVAREPA